MHHATDGEKEKQPDYFAVMKIILLFFLLFSLTAHAQIPLPRQQVFTEGFYVVGSDSALPKEVSVQLNNKYDSLIGEEGYRIQVIPDAVHISANTKAGLFYAKNTLLTHLKLQPVNGNKKYILPCMEVTDYPTYHYRGMHLDVARHFFSIETVKAYIDVIAQLKMNYFHWHLTDDQGWRIEIKQYPQLTAIGAWRTEKDGTRYGGYYTQEQIKEVVDYAAAKHVTIIPEIDLPGHSSAAVAAYPWLSCYGKQIQVPATWGIKKDILCPTDSTFIFLRNVFDEIITLFPGKYIHIGGDEVPKHQWRESDYVQKLMQEKAYANVEQVQHYFMKRVADYLQSKNKRCIGWGEVMRGGENQQITVMSWLDKYAGIKAAKANHQVVMAPRFYCYFDYPQKRSERKKAWWMVYLPIQKVYRFTPTVKALSTQANSNIIGGEATLWTEYDLNEKQLFHQLSPRVFAISEALWGTNKDYKNFSERLEKLRHTSDFPFLL